MIRRRIFCARRAAVIAALALAVFAGVAAGHAAVLDPSKMAPDEIKALEQRLTDAGCYKSAIDGTASAALDDAIKACPDQRPFLRIETGMHTAEINGIGVDAACSLLATASDDKTVRLWSLPDGKLKKVVRWPIGGGDAGKVYATALSPDGRWLAAGGWDTSSDKTGTDSLMVVDLSSGGIRRFGRFENVVQTIVYSADGRRIAVGLGSTGVRVLDSASGMELLADRNYGGDVYGLAYSPDGALIASSSDGQLRRYGPDLKLTVKQAAPGGKYLQTVAIDPSSRLVAVSYLDQTLVSILDARTLKPLAKSETSDLSGGDLDVEAWSRDGATLIAGGKARAKFGGELRSFLRRFDANGRRQGADVAVSVDEVIDIRSCGDGFVFASEDPVFGVLSSQGVATTLQGPRAADMREKGGSAFTVSRNGSSVRFGLGYGEAQPVLFDLAAASLTDAPSLPSGLAPARVDGLPVREWRETYAPKFKGARLALDDHERSHAVAVRPDASGFALGAEWSVRAYDAIGKERWNRAGPGGAWGVDFSADGEIVVVAYADGTIRWLRWSDGEELLAFFVEPQSRKWVAWTPSGYYMASAGGEDLIGWHVNRGWNQEADFFPASEFRAQYNRPDVVRLILKTRDEAEAVRQANKTSDKTSDRSVPAKPVAGALPPVVTIQSPPDGSHFSGESVEIVYALRSSTGQPIDRLDVLADGQPIRTIGFERTGPRDSEGRAAVTLPRQNTALSLIAHSGDLTSAPVSVKLIYDGPKPVDMSDTRPKLYALLVGVTEYDDAEYNTLKFTAHDAEEFAKALKAQKGRLYSDVQTKIIDDPKILEDDPTQHNVFLGLEWLKHTVTEHDLSIVFLAGHGYPEGKNRFWFLTREADVGKLRATAISNDDLLDYISSFPGKKIIFIDACHAGNAISASIHTIDRDLGTNLDMNQVVNDFSAAGTGVVVYGASMGKETSKEDASWDGHGAFTKALIEAIGEGKATTDSSKPITTELLAYYVAERVKQLTGGKQHPVMNRPSLVPDFPIALGKP